MRQTLLHECLRQFESDTRSAESLARIFTAGLIRVQHGQSMRHTIGTRKMMVGNDQVDAEAASGFGSSECADTGIHTNNEMNAGRRRTLDDVAAQIVAFFN